MATPRTPIRKRSRLILVAVGLLAGLVLCAVGDVCLLWDRSFDLGLAVFLLRGRPRLRAAAAMTSGALLASLVAATVATPASAATRATFWRLPLE